MTRARLGSVALDCDDPCSLALFWSGLLDGEITFTSASFTAVRLEQLWLSFVKVENFVRPTWPDGNVPKQIHLDLAVDDLDEVQEKAIQLGAHLAKDQPAPDRWRVLFDPAGHPFCLSSQIPE